MSGLDLAWKHLVLTDLRSYIDEQLALEADAREALPYKFDKCTNVLGPLRQELYACLTCSPPPGSAAQVYTPAGICYACSISCHGEHSLVELFHRRNFVCDCGTSRFPSTSPCTLRSDPATGRKGVASEEAAKGNNYNQNFQNKFCACGEEYDADTEKGTMFQCIGLGTVETGGCGEDWYHPECLMGLPKDWNAATTNETKNDAQEADSEEKERPAPPGFPNEDDFEALVCYKCVESNPWIKPYAGTTGFLSPVFRAASKPQVSDQATVQALAVDAKPSLKRKASDNTLDENARSMSPSKRLKEDETPQKAAPDTSAHSQPPPSPKHKHSTLPPAPSGTFTLFLKEAFRAHLCHCPSCYPNLLPHPQLVEEEDNYEPSVSNDSGVSDNQSNPLLHSQRGSDHRSQRSGSLLDRGEAALNNVDRVRAIEGVMVYNHLKDKVKEFLKPFAESGQAVSADDIKSYFEKLRGDEEGIKEAGELAEAEGGDNKENDHRKEQGGY